MGYLNTPILNLNIKYVSDLSRDTQLNVYLNNPLKSDKVPNLLSYLIITISSTSACLYLICTVSYLSLNRTFPLKRTVMFLSTISTFQHEKRSTFSFFSSPLYLRSTLKYLWLSYTEFIILLFIFYWLVSSWASSSAFPASASENANEQFTGT